jgi:sugar/nucleoside kinase (ribokinase family)
VIALLGNLARDIFPGGEVRAGGAPYHAARALAYLGVAADIYARCSAEDRGRLLPAVVALGNPVTYVPGRSTASFRISEHGLERQMEVLAVGDSWLASDLPALRREAGWVHVAPLLRSDFPPETLALLGRARHLSLDGQGLVRANRLGRLKLDADYDPELLRHVRVLKLSDEEADVLGDPTKLGVDELLVTHGPTGATLYEGRRREEISARAVGGTHTGTGDAFCVSYLVGRDAGLAPVAAAVAASAAVSELLSEPR